MRWWKTCEENLPGNTQQIPWQPFLKKVFAIYIISKNILWGRLGWKRDLCNLLLWSEWPDWRIAWQQTMWSLCVLQKIIPKDNLCDLCIIGASNVYAEIRTKIANKTLVLLLSVVMLVILIGWQTLVRWQISLKCCWDLLWNFRGSPSEITDNCISQFISYSVLHFSAAFKK